MAAIKYWLWLASQSNVSPRARAALIAHYGGAEEAFFAPSGAFARLPGLTERDAALLEVRDLTIREVDLDTASGECLFENCALEKLDLDTASGDLRITGTLNQLDCDAASASVYAVLENVPTRIKMNSMSGDLDLTLPKDAGFTAEIDGMSSDFSSDFATSIQNGRHVCGNGSCQIQMDAMSGNAIIRKGV